MRSRVRFAILPWEFFLAGKFPVVTMVWLVSRFRLKAPPGISCSCISTLTSSGQRSSSSLPSQPHKSATLSPQPVGKTRKFIEHVVALGRRKQFCTQWYADFPRLKSLLSFLQNKISFPLFPSHTFALQPIYHHFVLLSFRHTIIYLRTQ